MHPMDCINMRIVGANVRIEPLGCTLWPPKKGTFTLGDVATPLEMATICPKTL